jgi:hypothetical protein
MPTPVRQSAPRPVWRRSECRTYSRSVHLTDYEQFCCVCASPQMVGIWIIRLSPSIAVWSIRRAHARPGLFVSLHLHAPPQDVTRRLQARRSHPRGLWWVFMQDPASELRRKSLPCTPVHKSFRYRLTRSLQEMWSVWGIRPILDAASMLVGRKERNFLG